MNKVEQSRRQFLRTASMASMAGLYASPFLLELNSLAAMAQGTGSTGYKALVCVFLQGGNDGHGTVIATDTDSFNAFTQARSGAPGLAYPQSELLPIVLNTPQSGRTFALNPSLTGVQNLFNAGRAAIVANTGTLIVPATKAQVNANSVPLPASLFSHFDQTAAWQAIAANGGSAEHVGWGGSVADLIESMNMNSNSMFTCISTAGIALFLSGQTSFQLNVTSAGPIPIYGLAQPPFALGVNRQIFYVQLGSFDTHNNQAITHAQLLTQLSQALEYFDGLMVAAGMSDQVTTFTASDFGRTLTSNSNGTDHGWGSHHFVLGGAVQGRDMYGQYPVVGANQANDVGAGRLIPTTSVDQYAGTLARWLGLSDGQIKQVFPNFANFGSNPYLGFMG